MSGTAPLKLPCLTLFIFCQLCNNVQFDGGSISGKILHPDNNLLVRLISEEGVDSTTRDPESQRFTFNNVKFGLCILEVRAEGYSFFEQRIILDKPEFVVHDIVLAKVPPQVPFLSPPNSQHIDSQYCSLYSPSISDSGFLVFIIFNSRMDTASCDQAITILPDSIGVQKTWEQETQLALLFPYRKLATIDTVKVLLSRTAKNSPWGDTIDSDCSFFFPIDTNYIRATRILNN